MYLISISLIALFLMHYNLEMVIGQHEMIPRNLPDVTNVTWSHVR